MKPRVPASKYKKFIEFVEFLKANNALVFFKYIDAEFLFYKDSEIWVDRAFTWRKTPDDYDFWQNIENKWDKLQREQNR